MPLMRVYSYSAQALARDYIGAGGQALVVYRPQMLPEKILKAQRRRLRRAKHAAHLCDRDRMRLHRTCERLGIRVVRIEEPNTEGQRVDLCGTALKKALLLCRVKGKPDDYTHEDS